MPTNITQHRSPDGRNILRVAGDMTLDDALLIERVVTSGEHGIGVNTTLDLADLTFIDSDAASVIKRLRDEHGVEIDGVEFFLQKAIDDAERAA